MFHQGMGDYFSPNYFCGPPAYEPWTSACPHGGYGSDSWYAHPPCNNANWMWNYGGYNNFNNSNLQRPLQSCFFYPDNYESMTAQNATTSDQQNGLIGTNSMNNEHERSSSSATDPLWKTIKIDYFTTKIGVKRTKSDTFDTSETSFSTKTTTTNAPQRKFIKPKLSTKKRDAVALKNMLKRLDKKVCINESILAYILLKMQTKQRDNEDNCGGCGDNAHNNSSAYCPDKRLHDMEDQLFEKLKRQFSTSNADTETSPRTSDGMKFAKDWNKLYHDLDDAFKINAKSKLAANTHLNEENGADVLKEFEDFFNEKSHELASQKSKTKKPKFDKKEVKKELKSEHKKSAMAKLLKPTAKAPSKEKQISAVTKTKHSEKENKKKLSEKERKKPTKNVKFPDLAKLNAPTLILGKRPYLTTSPPKPEKQIPTQPQLGGGTCKSCTPNTTKAFKHYASGAPKFRIFLDNCVYTAESKQK